MDNDHIAGWFVMLLVFVLCTAFTAALFGDLNKNQKQCTQELKECHHRNSCQQPEE